MYAGQDHRKLISIYIPLLNDAIDLTLLKKLYYSCMPNRPYWLHRSVCCRQNGEGNWRGSGWEFVLITAYSGGWVDVLYFAYFIYIHCILGLNAFRKISNCDFSGRYCDFDFYPRFSSNQAWVQYSQWTVIFTNIIIPLKHYMPLL